MRRDHDWGEAQHRRGVLMGLTVAESFMLIAFALLMLLSLWRIEADGEIAFAEMIDMGERAAIEKLSRSGELDVAIALAEAGVSPGVALAALKQTPPAMTTVSIERLEALSNAARLVEEADIRAIAELAATLPPERRRQLDALVALEDYREALEKIAAYDALKATVETLTRAEPLNDRLRGRIAAYAAEQAALVSDLRSALDAPVEAIGGSIGADGVIRLPDSAIFERASATITPKLARFLESFCSPWVATLRASGRDVDEIRIEGHSSPEWGDASRGVAFERNLELSQRRAAAVLLRCIDLMPTEEEKNWALQKVAAVGYSSSRPVMTDGEVDAAQSRRIAFSAKTPQDRLIEEIETEVAAALAPQAPLAEEPRVEVVYDRGVAAGLREAASAFRPLSWDDARRALYSNVAVGEDGMVRGIYSGFVQPGRVATFLDPIEAEHIVPQSWYDRREPMRSDLHGLAPAHGRVNTARRDSPFAEIPDATPSTWWSVDATGQLVRLERAPAEPARFAQVGAGAFEPPDSAKGDVARAILYFYVMYPDELRRIEGLVRGGPRVIAAWSRLDPPDDAERRRNDRIEAAQGNRNPFIDDPDLVCVVWIGAC